MLVENCSRGVFIDHSIGDAMSLNAVTCLAFFREEHHGALCCRLIRPFAGASVFRLGFSAILRSLAVIAQSFCGLQH